MFTRRHFLSTSLSAASLAAGVAGRPAGAQANVTRLYVGFAVGGGVDLAARALADQLKSQLPETVIVENKTGAGGQIAVETVKRSAPDGMSLLMTPSSVLTLYPHTKIKVPYDPIADLTQVARVASIDFGFAVHPSLNVTSLHQYVEEAKKKRQLGNYGSPGAGLTPHFVGMMLARAAGLDMLHVPYRGTAAALADLVANQISAVSSTAATLVAGHRAGQWRILATSGKTRNPDLPDVPTFAEAGFDVPVVEDWTSLSVPTATPKSVVEKLNKEVLSTLADPKLIEQFRRQGFYPAGTSPDETARLLKADHDMWKEVVQKLGFVPTE